MAATSNRQSSPVEDSDAAADRAVCTDDKIHQPPVSSRQRRKRTPNARYSSSSSSSSVPEDRNEEQPEKKRQKMKRVQTLAEVKEPPGMDAAPAPSKEYLAEGSEHVYRTHACPKCRRCFKMRSHLKEHLHLHFPDAGLRCPACERCFTSKSKLRVHRLHEAGEKVHRCHLCDYSAVERNAIRRHLVSVHAAEAGDGGGGGDGYPCPACGQSFQQSRSLKAHMKTHNLLPDNGLRACFRAGCPFQGSSRKELVRHAAAAHGAKASGCRHHACGAVFQSEADMEAHYRTHLAYHCSQCGLSCSNKTVFLQHRRRGHPGSDELRCDFCPYVTLNPVAFERHVGLLHANEKTHRCPQCSYVTSHKRGLKRHMLVHSGEKPHKCSLCEFRCRDESYLSKHMLTHSDDKNFMCAECGYVTKWKHYLSVHMRKHAGDLRYHCNQCPYRSHRMDQLNSHKLRHQAKSLMCEICAYACKRKYELRNHMLAKHSGGDKQPTVHRCRYCAYATRYRQALQNHENCKHTKLKEFRCALCVYSAFSSVSLFLHKRKAHGYVPGDNAWLENYAAKEKERSSTEFSQDFYIKASAARGRPGQTVPEAPPPAEPSEETATDAFAVVSPEVVNEDGPSYVNGPEEYCTLVLTTLAASDYLQNDEETSKNQTANNFTCNESNASQEKADFSPASPEEADATVSAPECEQRGPAPSSHASQPAEPGERRTQTPEAGAAVRGGNQPSESELRLKAMKKHDKDQAEAMVLEGRVQMLVEPTKDVHRCDKCSYVTSKETALNYHRQALCDGRTKVHQCRACGAQFKQRRGLESHLAKKCPALRRKTRTFVRISNARLAAEGFSPDGREESTQPEERPGSDQAALPSSQNRMCTSSSGQKCPQQESGEQESLLANCRGLSRNAVAFSESERQLDGELLDSPKNLSHLERRNPPESLYTKTGGKFRCKLCSFSSAKIVTVKRHLSTCRKTSRKDAGRMASEAGDGCDDSKSAENQSAVCSMGARSKMALTRHALCVRGKKQLGVAKSRHKCKNCTFTCKQERRMAQHVALAHKGARPHRCRYCPFSTARRYRLAEHQSLHTGLGRHSCDLCEKTFGAAAKLRQHKTRIHDKRLEHSCSLCDFSGYTRDDVSRHGRRCHAGGSRHACTRCDARFSSDVALRNHCRRAHRLQACFSCKRCDYACGDEVTLKAHQEAEHPQAKCAACRESFKTKEGLAAHQRGHLAQPCGLCAFATKTRQLLAQHLLSEHEVGSPDSKPLKCGACPFACRSQLVLEQHLRSHGGKRLYKCTECKYSTRNRQKITWHIRIHTGEKPYSCELCAYACADPSRLRLHMRVHQEEKKFLCPQCGYKCKWATQLKYHMTKHTGEKPHACKDCAYRTNRADALRSHRDTQHCEKRPFVCEKCGKAFKTSFILKTHQRQHSDGRPYACGLCGKAFRWPAGLRHHYLSHTKQQPFSCRHCSYRAKQRFQVVKHLRKHHPEMSTEQGVERDSEALGLTLREALQGTLGERAAGEEGTGTVEEVVKRGGDGKTKEDDIH
ncbi:zinc finger protein 142 [Brachionichthys hirsutus]|uniref:zinc finger protein 142 n=1 Tax=Brachionichthys hirsutus TaxID=412623 RepID=UPI0036047088